MSATAAIGLRDVSLGGVLFGSGRLDVGVTGRDLTAALEFPAMGLSATGHGRLEEGRTVTAQARLERANLDPIVAQLAPAARGRVLGRVSARAEAEVPLWRPGEIRMTASITPDELVVAGGRWTTRSPAVIRWDRGRLTVDQFRAEGPPGTITASAVMEAGGSDARIAIGLEQARLPPPFDRATPGDVRGEARLTRTALEAVSIRGRWPVGTLSLDGRVPFEGPIALRSRLMADGAELARALGQDRVAGQAIVSADVSGSWREPVASGRLEATALTSAEVTLTGVTVPFRLTPSTIRIADARAVLGKDPLALEGEASWATGGWRGRGTLTAPVLTVGGWPIEALHAAFRMDAERLEATAVSTRVRGVAVRGTGSWQWSGGGRLEARLGPAELAELRAVPPALDLAGSASGRLEAVFRSLEDVTASLALRFDGVRAAGEALGAGTLAAELRGRAVRAELGFPERRLSAVAEGRAETGATMRVRAAVDDLPLGELGRRLGLGERATVDGSVSARLLAEVPLDRPRAGRGTLRLDPLRLVVAGEALASREPIVASFDAGALRVERLLLEGRAGTITGRGALHAGGALDAELRGQIPLGVLAALRPEVEAASGMLDVSVTARGTMSAPEISGAGALHGASVTVRGYAEPVREIQARLTASPAGLRLIEARGVLGGGTLTASGEAALADGGLGAYRVALTARRVAVTPLDGLSTLWDGDLELAGRAARGLLQGELRLVRGMYTRELAPGAGAPQGVGRAGGRRGRAPLADHRQARRQPRGAKPHRLPAGRRHPLRRGLHGGPGRARDARDPGGPGDVPGSPLHDPHGNRPVRRSPACGPLRRCSRHRAHPRVRRDRPRQRPHRPAGCAPLVDPSALAGGSPGPRRLRRHARRARAIARRRPRRRGGPDHRPRPPGTRRPAGTGWRRRRRAAAPGGNPDGARADDPGRRPRDGERRDSNGFGSNTSSSAR